MGKKENILSFTAEDIDAKLAAGESRTDWAKADGISQADIERLAHEDEGALPDGLEKTRHHRLAAWQGCGETAHRPGCPGMVSPDRKRVSDPHEQCAACLCESPAGQRTQPEINTSQARRIRNNACSPNMLASLRDFRHGDLRPASSIASHCSTA